MVDIIWSKALLNQFVSRQVFRELMDDSSDDLQMRQFFCTDIRQHCLLFSIGHRVPLGKVAHGGAHLAVRAAVLAHDELSHLRVRLLDIYRILQSLLI